MWGETGPREKEDGRKEEQVEESCVEDDRGLPFEKPVRQVTIEHVRDRVECRVQESYRKPHASIVRAMAVVEPRPLRYRIQIYFQYLKNAHTTMSAATTCMSMSVSTAPMVAPAKWPVVMPLIA